MAQRRWAERPAPADAGVFRRVGRHVRLVVGVEDEQRLVAVEQFVGGVVQAADAALAQAVQRVMPHPELE